MKKLLALLLAGAMCLPMLACTAENKPADTETPSVEVTQPVTDPEESSSAEPDESVADPDGTATDPDGSVIEPDTSVTEPDETIPEPEDTTSKPEDTTTKPAETTAKPAETTAKPEETTSKPQVSKPDSIPSSGIVVMSTLSSQAGYMSSFVDAGYTSPVIVLGYDSPIYLGHINLANYSKVRIQYGCDGSDVTKQAFNASASLAIGLKKEASSYGHGGTNNYSGDIVRGRMTFSSENWAYGARWVEIDLTKVKYSGDVWLAVHNPEGTQIAISSIIFTPNGQSDVALPELVLPEAEKPVETKPAETQPSTPPVTQVKDPVYNVSLDALYLNATSSDGLTFNQNCSAAWGASKGYVTLTANGPDPYVTAIPIGSGATVTKHLYVLYRTTTQATAELFIGSGDGWGAGDHVPVSPYTADGKWHLLCIDLSGAANLVGNRANFLRFDFFANVESGKVDVKMMAFFNSDAEAKAYAAAKYGSDYSGTYTPPVIQPPVTDAEITMPGNLNLPYVPPQPVTMNKDWKAIWLSQFDLSAVYQKGGGQRPQAEFRSLIDQMLNNVKNDGYNTIVVQVRPNGDSMYPSAYYPASKYVVGSYGRDFSYDPFAIIVEIAHQKGLDVHAWINPMRGMSDSEIQSISTNYVIRRWYNDASKRGTYIVKVNNMWYLNPAYEEVRALIVNGAVEIVNKYDVQGVHMDDYFYPVGPDNGSFDAAAYQEYCRTHGNVGVANFRRDALNKLVSALYGYIKKADSSALFGVSPAGNLTTVQNTHCADVNTWCSTPGYIDYICPQIYFGFNHATHAFDKACNMWQNIIKTNYVKLIIGVTFHKVGTEDTYAGANGKYEWQTYNDILARSVNYAKSMSKCVGITVFSYNYIYDPVSGAWKNETSAEHANFNNAFKSASFNARSK